MYSHCRKDGNMVSGAWWGQQFTTCERVFDHVLIFHLANASTSMAWIWTIPALKKKIYCVEPAFLGNQTHDLRLPWWDEMKREVIEFTTFLPNSASIISTVSLFLLFPWHWLVATICSLIESGTFLPVGWSRKLVCRVNSKLQKAQPLS